MGLSVVADLPRDSIHPIAVWHLAGSCVCVLCWVWCEGDSLKVDELDLVSADVVLGTVRHEVWRNRSQGG